MGASGFFGLFLGILAIIYRQQAATIFNMPPTVILILGVILIICGIAILFMPSQRRF